MDHAAAAQLRAESRDIPSWNLTNPQLQDLELLLQGAYAPLTGFMTKREYESVLAGMRLPDGSPWPVAVVLEVSESFTKGLSPGTRVALREPEGMMVAELLVDEIWSMPADCDAPMLNGPNPSAETIDNVDASVVPLRRSSICLGGTVRGVEAPVHYDFTTLRNSPADVLRMFGKLGWRRVIGYHSARPMHRAEVEMTRKAARAAEANLLLQPLFDPRDPGDIRSYALVRCYEKVVTRFPEGSAILSLLQTRPRTGLRGLMLHAIIARNFGCTHYLPGLDVAGPHDLTTTNSSAIVGNLRRFEPDIGIEILAPNEMRYVPERSEFLPASCVSTGQNALTLDSQEVERRLTSGLDVPTWFSYPEVIEELQIANRPLRKTGITIFFTGLSGAGKSSIARVLVAKLMGLGSRAVTLLDGDIVRRHLSSELGFSREHRDLNILRIGFVASEITRHGGIAVCAPIAPYAETRRKVREMVAGHGAFFEIYVSTPLAVCETRDRKGLYAKARAGTLSAFTGISDPYEAPEAPDLEIDTQSCTPLEAAQRILTRLEVDGYIG
jgi:sulfate adenylyltransferase